MLRWKKGRMTSDGSTGYANPKISRFTHRNKETSGSDGFGDEFEVYETFEEFFF